MNPEQITRLRRGFALLAADADGFARRFYDELFRIAPDARGLFTVDMALQRTKFVTMMASLVDMLDSASQSDVAARELGERHVGYGVRESDYDAVGTALLICLRHRLGEEWDEAMETAWATFYGELAEAMIDGAEQA